MSRAETARRYVLFIISLFFVALGVAFAKHAGLGVSPTSSLANVMSCRFTSLTLGTWQIIWNCVLIVGQILLLRRNFQPLQLLQLPLSFLFGFFTDLCMELVAGLPTDLYPVRILWVLVGTCILAFGVALSVIANVIMNSGEAFVKAVADTLHQNFGNVKLGFDITCVVLAVLVSLLMFGGAVVGTREGTVITALLTGPVVKVYTKHFTAPMNRILSGRAAR